MFLVWAQSMGLVSTTHHPTQSVCQIGYVINSFHYRLNKGWGEVEEGVRIDGNITINKGKRDVGGSMAVAQRQRQRQRRWRQREAWRRHTARHKVDDDDGDGAMDNDINNNCDSTLGNDDEKCNIY
jgi:hypothetical protein